MYEDGVANTSRVNYLSILVAYFTIDPTAQLKPPRFPPSPRIHILVPNSRPRPSTRQSMTCHPNHPPPQKCLSFIKCLLPVRKGKSKGDLNQLFSCLGKCSSWRIIPCLKDHLTANVAGRTINCHRWVSWRFKWFETLNQRLPFDTVENCPMRITIF